MRERFMTMARQSGRSANIADISKKNMIWDELFTIITYMNKIYGCGNYKLEIMVDNIDVTLSFLMLMDVDKSSPVLFEGRNVATEHTIITNVTNSGCVVKLHLQTIKDDVYRATTALRILKEQVSHQNSIDVIIDDALHILTGGPYEE